MNKMIKFLKSAKSIVTAIILVAGIALAILKFLYGEEKTTPDKQEDTKIQEEVMSEFESYMKRAKSGHNNSSSQYTLATMYEKGEGDAPESIFHAYMWYNIAAANGHKGAKNKVVELGKKLSEIDTNLFDANWRATDCMSSDYKNCGH